MGHTYSNLLSHIIFSTKDRVPYLRREQRERVFAYLGGIAREIHITAMNVGGDADHVHLLVKIPCSMSLSEVVNKIKTNSSRWIHENKILHRTSSWQQG